MLRSALPVALLLAALSPGSVAQAGGCPRGVEVRMAPIPGAQIAVWVEDGSGRVIDTVYVTRSTGMLGLGNRPGNPRFPSDYRWPYGAREMVLPVWAHARGITYGRVVMGGISGYEDNDTIANHFNSSSPETFYCSPSGGTLRVIDGVDTVSCASPFFGCKGRYAMDGSSVYPPRADLVDFNTHDHPDAERFADDNDVAVVSGATPPGGAEISPPLRWIAPDTVPDGSYRLRVEVSAEADFNAVHRHPSFLDDDAGLRAFGHDILGQPPVVWEVPFMLDETPRIALGADYAGYGDWDGATGTMHPPDVSITDGVEGSGAGRLLLRHDGDGAWRVKLVTLGCQAACAAPLPPEDLALTPADTSVEVSFNAPAGDSRPVSYDLRYRVGAPLTDEDFALGTPGVAPPPGDAGARQHLTVSGIKPDSAVWIGLRAVSACGKPSSAAIAGTGTLSASFATLHGCFVATAAWGSPLAEELSYLRAFRDRWLLTSPLGQVAVAVYYALSPPLARAIAADERLRAGARALLSPLVRVIAAGRSLPCSRSERRVAGGRR